MSASQFSQQTTAQEVIQGVDLSGQVAVVTGGASGLGEKTAEILAAAGASVVITARNAARGMAAVARLRKLVPEAALECVAMELEDLKSVREAAADIQQRHPAIHMLINNAGIMACPLSRTAEGCESQFGVNHIGHFLFTSLLVPALLAAAPSRVVNLSSGGHKYSPVLFDDPHFEQRDYDKWVAYGQAKTANALFSVALNQRLASRGVTANAVHPGAIATNLGRHMSQEDYAQFGTQMESSGMVFKTVDQGAATTIWAATSPELTGRGGLYLEDCQVGVPASESTPSSGYFDYALDPDQAERLWQLSEQVVGESFDFS